MQRKAIQLAGKTIVISLPSKWVKANNVIKGDELEIEEQERRIIVSTNKVKKSDKIIIDADENYDPLYIAYLYQAGVDEIRVNYKDSKVYQKIQEKIPSLMGYEIIDQGEKYLEIKNVSATLEEEFETILRRTFFLLEEIAKSSLEAIEKKEYIRLKDLLTMENSIDKFTDFCKRILNKIGYKDSLKTQFYYVIIRDLEKIGDYYEEIIKHAYEEKTTMSQETIKLFQETNEFLKMFHALFYKFEKDNINRFLQKKKELKNKEKFKKADNKELLIIYNLMSAIRTIGNLYGPYYSTRI
ncbi:phosphate uptake regulator PhoU [archaeon]|nr:phosphate uptake regulator PhoU [archaeon]MBL7056953.1 phosphate uptake regulator PhoU [Candidatus Woesearchaeota archaeon]